MSHDGGLVPATRTDELGPKAGASVRVALLTGFAIVFALWLLWGYQLVRSLEEIERNLSLSHQSYVRDDEILSRIRTNVLLGSIYLRDALIDGGDARRAAYRTELTRLQSEIEALLRTYVPEVVSQNGRDHWLRLQIELGRYWASRDVAFTGRATTPAEAAGLLRTGIVRHRETVLEIVDQLAALQSVANDRLRQASIERYHEVRTGLLWMGVAALIVALSVAVIAAFHVHRLQRQIERQRRIERRNREDLERLSARLVAAQEQERCTLARELHDEVGQALTAVKMDIGIALRAGLDPHVRSGLEEARTVTETTLRNVRDMSQLLHPSVLDDFGLPATLTTYLRNFSQRTSIRAQLAETMDARLDAHIELCVYRIVQEALNNVAQHSGASACTVSLNSGGGMLRLSVEDNGRGLGPMEKRPGATRGLGLIGMRERAQALGGSFAIDARPGGGTIVNVTLPLTDTDAGGAEADTLEARRAG